MGNFENYYTIRDSQAKLYNYTNHTPNSGVDQK